MYKSYYSICKKELEMFEQLLHFCSDPYCAVNVILVLLRFSWLFD